MELKFDARDAKRFAQLIRNMDLKKHDQEINKIVRGGARPIITAARRRAKSVVNRDNRTFNVVRSGTTYIIEPGTIQKSIGILRLSRASKFAVYIGYRLQKPYEAWFAHFVDGGTDEFDINNVVSMGGGDYVTFKKGGGIQKRNIMAYGQEGYSRSIDFIHKAVLRLEKKILSK
jgi:hypothetical protein